MESRWWDYYLVRYLVGTVVGALVVSILAANPTYSDALAPLLGNTNQEFLRIGIRAAAGFAFCYVASTPILAVHALRAHLQWTVISKYPIHSVFSVVAVLGLWLWCASHRGMSLVFWIVGLVIALQLVLIVVAISTSFKAVDDYYRALATNRSNATGEKDEPPSPGMEYITSYRHLREHGNAVLIVVLEGTLAAALYSVGKGHADSAISILAAWLAPAALVWFIGTVLESRFVGSALPPRTPPPVTSSTGTPPTGTQPANAPPPSAPPAIPH